MIRLFNIPNYTIDTGQFSNLLSDKIVRGFEERFAEYVGAKYAVSVHSATAAIFLCLYGEGGEEVTIPSLIPPVVANAIDQALCYVKFEDNVKWVGHDYVLHEFSNCKIIDSAQRVSYQQFANEADPDDLMIFSFFPTKPVGSCDGGMIVSNNLDAIEKIRILANNGMIGEGPSWEKEHLAPGFKLYMNSIAAWIANENLKKLSSKKFNLSLVRNRYNAAFGLENDSDHLYRIPVTNNVEFLKKAREAGIECGIHYQALHLQNCFKPMADEPLPDSERDARTMVSIPFREDMKLYELNKVMGFVNQNR